MDYFAPVIDAVLSQTGVVGALLLLTIFALITVWRGGEHMTDRFIAHLQTSEQRDLDMRERETAVQHTVASALQAIVDELREHDRRTTAMLIARPTGGADLEESADGHATTFA